MKAFWAVAFVVLGVVLWLSMVRPKAVPKAQPAPENAPEQTPRAATLSQQKMCADQAEREFNKYYKSADPKFIANEYTSHYDPQANVCYMMVHSTYVEAAYRAYSFSVDDAFEGRDLAQFYQYVPQAKADYEVKPSTCFVKPHGEPIHCDTSEEFEGLVEKYFGVSR